MVGAAVSRILIGATTGYLGRGLQKDGGGAIDVWRAAVVDTWHKRLMISQRSGSLWCICTPDDVSCGETGCSCEATGMCSDGFTCLDGECREDEDLCRFNTECGGDGRICLDGRCTTGCETSAECVGGQICIDNFCQDDTAPVPECVRNETCETGEVCEDGRCVAECDRDRDCGDGLYCRSGRCAVDDRPRPFCEVDADCRFACVNGVCRTPCETSRMCAEVDVQFSACFEDYCATANEATRDCSISADCASGRECIDGSCRCATD